MSNVSNSDAFIVEIRCSLVIFGRLKMKEFWLFQNVADATLTIFGIVGEIHSVKDVDVAHCFSIALW